MTLKQFRLAAGKRLLDKKKPPVTTAVTNGSKILFVRYDGKIGDFIVSSFIYREIKKEYPGAVIHMVINAGLLPLVENNRYIDTYFVMKGRSYAEIIQTSKRLQKQRYDILIDPTPFLRNRDLLFIRNVNAGINIGYGKDAYGIFNSNLPALAEHTSQIYKRILQLLGINGVNTSYDVTIPAEAKETVDRFFAQHHITKAIAINFFGASRSRNIMEPLAEKMINLVLKHFNGCTVILLTFPQAVSFTGKLVSRFNNPLVVHFEGTKTIFETAAIIARVNLLVSPDTSVIHLADYFAKPMLAMYSDDEENYTKWHPLHNVPVIRYSQNVNNTDVGEVEKKLIALKLSGINDNL